MPAYVFTYSTFYYSPRGLFPSRTYGVQLRIIYRLLWCVVSAYYLWSTTLTEGNAHVQHILPLCSEHQAYLLLPLVVLSGKKYIA